MERHALEELHYIAPIANLPSMLERGLLSHRRAGELPEHTSIALAEVQARRAAKRVPGGQPLHEYVNLYICARNPMLYTRLNRRHEICVLSIATAVLDLDGAVVTDGNAASDYVRFLAAPDGLAAVDEGRVFAEFWTHPDDPIEQLRHRVAKCAEVLVPDQVDSVHINRAYVCGDQARAAIETLEVGINVAVDQHMFFNQT